MADLFATCPRGLETLLAEELAACGGQEVAPTGGGVACRGDAAVCYRANLNSHVATRVLWRVAAGDYRNEQDIYELARGVPWHDWLSVEHTLRVQVAATGCRLRSLDFVTLRIKDAVCDQMRERCGARPSVDTAHPDVRVHAHLDAQRASLYLDTSGEPLYKRGFKVSAAAAPLKENLAAGILRLTGWQPDEPLLDPMCGSGTFLIEAALIGRRIAPGLARGFGFERLGNFVPTLWRQIREDAHARARPQAALQLFGSDSNRRLVEATRSNLLQAGMDGAAILAHADVRTAAAPAASGVLIANPPYGVRVGERDELAEFYPRLGDAFKQRYAGWRCYLLSADKELAKRIGLRASRRIPLYNGALECRLYEYRMVSGRLREAGAEKTNAA